MTATLTLDLPWLPAAPVDLPDVDIVQGSPNRLTFDDGVDLAVRIVNVSADEPINSILRRARAHSVPGQVTLIVGSVPVEARPTLRAEKISWLATDGRMELRWPRLSVSAHRISPEQGSTRSRHREPVALQKKRALVAQRLCELSLDGRLPLTISEIAESSHVSPAVASEAVSSLASHGYVTKIRTGNYVRVHVPDVASLARLLASRTSWRHAQVVWAYGFGRSSLDVAHRLSSTAHSDGIPAAVTGRVGAMFLGVLGTDDPPVIRIRANVSPSQVPEALEALDLEPVDREAANVAVAVDRWGLGTIHAKRRERLGYTAMVAPTIRVWCDTTDEPRGTDFAAQLWETIEHGE